MKNWTTKRGVLVACVLAAGLILGAWQSGSPAPARLALVNLEQVMAGLAEAKARSTEIGDRAKGLQKQIDEMESEIKGLQARREQEPAGSRTRRDTEARIIVLNQTRQAQLQASQRLLDLEKGGLLREMYLKIVAECEKYAKSNGYDLIVADDRTITPPEGATDQQVNLAVQSRRVLAARNEIDLTPAIITAMNNAFNAGAAAPAPGKP